MKKHIIKDSYTGKPVGTYLSYTAAKHNANKLNACSYGSSFRFCVVSEEAARK